MIRLACKLPFTINIAFSGGVDSVAAAHFLKRGGRDVTLLHFNHGCEYSDDIERGCAEVAHVLGLPMIVGKNENPERPKGRSLEDHWRRNRYNFLRAHSSETVPFVTAHHLDDAVENWVMTSLHGNPRVIPVSGPKMLRPFLLTEKATLVDYAKRHGLPVVHDPYNQDLGLTRNYVRANLMQHAYVVNPGLNKVIRKMYLRGVNDDLR